MHLFQIFRKRQILPGITYLQKNEGDDFQQDDLYIDKKGRYTASKKKGWRIYDDDSWGDLNGEYVDALKAHVTSMITGVTINVWTDFSGFTLVEEDTLTEYLVLGEDTKTIIIGRDGLYQFGGCVHVQNNTTGKITVTILSRILKNGTTELRCSQRGKVEDINASGEDVMSYGGSDLFAVGDTVTLQYYTDNASLEFYSNSNFQESVAATLWMVYLGNNV